MGVSQVVAIDRTYPPPTAYLDLACFTLETRADSTIMMRQLNKQPAVPLAYHSKELHGSISEGVQLYIVLYSI